MTAKKLSIIIPVYNEERTINKILNKVELADSCGLEKEIIIVDDCSQDRSGRIIEEIQPSQNYVSIKKISHEKNLGKGAAVRSGLKEATGDIALIQDADLEYDPSDYEKLLEPIIGGRSEVVFGSRLKEMPLVFFGKSKTPFLSHYLGNRFLSFLTSILFSAEITDMETGYKIMTRSVYQPLQLESNGFDLEPEITAKILKNGFSIIEIPIKTTPRGYLEGKKIHWWNGLEALIALVKYRFEP